MGVNSHNLDTYYVPGPTEMRGSREAGEGKEEERDNLLDLILWRTLTLTAGPSTIYLWLQSKNS